MNLSDLVPRPEFLPEFKDWPSIRNVKIAITGAKGTLGTLLLERLSRAGMQAACFHGDITNGPQLQDWIASVHPGALFHLAAIVPLDAVEADPIRAMQVNATALLTLVSGIRDHVPDCWLFYPSTSHVYQSSEFLLTETSSTNPVSLYGATKLAGEAVIRPLANHISIRLCIARIFSYFHELQDASFLIPGIVKKVESSDQGSFIHVYNTQSKRDFLHAPMVIDAILHILSRRHSGTINIGSGHATSVMEMAERVISLSGKGLTIRPVDIDAPTTIVADVTRLKSLLLARAP